MLFCRVEEDVELNKVINRLKLSRNNDYVLQRKRAEEAEILIRTKLAWLPRNFTVPNIFLQPDKQSVIVQDGKNDNRTLVFVHHPRAAGGHVISCLNNISYTKNMAMSPLMNSKNRLLWDTGNPDTVSFQNRINIHRGGYAFGVCEKLQQDCHYFTLFRDPLETMLSMYDHCVNVGTHEFCSILKSKFVSRRDWIIENGGLMLNHFLYSSHLCVAQHSDSSTDVFKNPCWLQQKLKIDRLTETEKDHVANYIARNLRRWFSVIGLFEEFKESLSMFEYALGENLTKCPSKKESSSTFEEEIQMTNKAHLLSNEERAFDDNEAFEDDVDMLRDDYYVQKALMPAYTIYSEAKRVFHFQRQILYNKMTKI